MNASHPNLDAEATLQISGGLSLRSLCFILLISGFWNSSLLAEDRQASKSNDVLGHHADINEVDFANLSYVFALDGPPEDIPLTNGRYDASQSGGFGFMSGRLISRRVCESEPLPRPLALVHLRFRWGGGSSSCVDSVYLYEFDEGSLIELDRVSGDCAGRDGATIDCGSGRLKLESMVWRDGDPHCCPSLRETSEYSFIDRHFELVARSRLVIR